jgi:hypothetical protein
MAPSGVVKKHLLERFMAERLSYIMEAADVEVFKHYPGIATVLGAFIAIIL